MPVEYQLDDPFVGKEHRLFHYFDDPPAGWDQNQGSIAFYKLDCFESDAEAIDLKDARLRRLLASDIEALRDADRQPLAPLAPGIFAGSYDGPGYSGIRPWFDFEGHVLPWVLEVNLTPDSFSEAWRAASYIRQKVKSALHLTTEGLFFTQGPAFYQPSATKSAHGLYALAASDLADEIPANMKCNLPAERLAHFRTIYERQTSITDGRARLAIRRFNLDYDRDRPDDALIDCWIGLEALFSRNPGDITYKAGIRIAYYICKDGDERRQLFPLLQDSYKKRSDLVHGRKFESTIIATSRRTASEALRRSLEKLLVIGQVPGETELDELIANGGPIDDSGSHAEDTHQRPSWKTSPNQSSSRPAQRRPHSRRTSTNPRASAHNCRCKCRGAVFAALISYPHSRLTL